MKDYTLDLPIQWSKESYSNTLEVTRESDGLIQQKVYQIATYFKEELHYDKIPFCPVGISNKPYKAIMFMEKDYNHIRNNNNNGLSPHVIYGGCVFTELIFTQEPNRWKLEWIWIHPFFRNRGKLNKHWEYLEKEFDDFIIGEPVSGAMQNFLTKIKSEHIIL